MTEKKDQQGDDTKNVKLLNWMDDDYTMEVTEGIKFDPEHDYTLELTAITRESGEKDGKEWQRLTCEWTEEETGVKIRQNHFLNPKATLNKDAPEKSSSLIKLANALGYKPAIGAKDFHPKKFLRVGMKIVAHIVDQLDKKGNKTNFSEIDIPSIRPAGKKAQQAISINKEDVAKWQKEISDGKYATAEKYVQNLAGTGRLPEVAPFMDAVRESLITFG